MNDTGQGPSRPGIPRPSGLVLSPFRALRFDTAVAGDLRDLTCPPYDVINADQAASLEALCDDNVVRLILPRDGVFPGQDRYTGAATLLRSWRERGVLAPDPTPALYVYEQADPRGHVQRGLVGALALSPPEDEIVLPHENTMAGPVSDRLALYTATGADLEPIFLVYDGGGAASEAVSSVDGPGTGELLVDAVLGDGLRHRLWALTDASTLQAVAEDLHGRKALIADGHHRYATYLRRQQLRHEAGHGPGPWDAGLCLLVDATSFGPEIHPIHRVVPGIRAGELARRAGAGMVVRRLETPLDEGLDALAAAGRSGPAFLLASGDAEELHLLSQPDLTGLAAALPAGSSAAWSGLDVTVLHAYVVPHLWGLADDVEHVGYAHEILSALGAATGTGGTAVLLNPTPVAAVAAVAAAGERMPRKSTLFTPKPRSGVVLRDHRDG
jgi:uncharacterized protein (DUF1015 family)